MSLAQNFHDVMLSRLRFQSHYLINVSIGLEAGSIEDGDESYYRVYEKLALQPVEMSIIDLSKKSLDKTAFLADTRNVQSAAESHLAVLSEGVLIKHIYIN